MIQETEDDRLDQSLRDTFSDFDLPPSNHVWAGIEGHLSALPGAPRPVPLLLVLPIVGLVGVAVGWLLPRPAVLSPAPQPTTEAAAKTRTASLQTQVLARGETAYIIPRSSTAALAFGYAPNLGSSQVSKSTSRPAQMPALDKGKSRKTDSHPVSHPELIASANTITPATVLPLNLASATEELLPSPIYNAVPAELPIVVQTAPVTDSQALDMAVAAVPPIGNKAVGITELSSKGEGLRERRPEYRVPTHRLAERGRGLRRIQNNLAKHWQHVFGSRRARVAAQPDF